MLVRPYERIEVLRASESQHLQFAFTDKLLQIPVDSYQANVGLATEFEKNLISGGMRVSSLTACQITSNCLVFLCFFPKDEVTLGDPRAMTRGSRLPGVPGLDS